jgi:hypothetical protein
VAWQELRTVGLALRREMAVAAAILAALSLPMLAAHLRTPGHTSDMQFAEMMMLTVVFGVFGAIAVWKGEEPARRAYFWSQPVDRTRHSLVKVFGGWAWVMVAVAVFVLWMVVLARLTGGELSLGDTRVPLRALPEGVARTAADYVVHAWPVPGWMWLVPFAAATAMYLLATIVVLSVNHPWRWFAGLVVGGVLVGVMGEAGVGFGEWVLNTGVEGRYGFERLVTGSSSELVPVAAPGGRQVQALAYVPRPAEWLVAVALWVGLALAGVLAAARRYSEG